MTDSAPTVQMQEDSNVATIATNGSRPALDVPFSVQKAEYGSKEHFEEATNI